MYTPTELNFALFISLEPYKGKESDIKQEVLDAYFHFLATIYPDIQFIPSFAIQVFMKGNGLIEGYNFIWQLSSLRYIFAPISMKIDSHWGLAVVHVQERKIIVMDSENKNRTKKSLVTETLRRRSASPTPLRADT